MKKLATLLSLIAALAIAVPVAAQARHMSDDPVGHVRHGGDGRATDDRRAKQSTATTKAPTTAKASKQDDRGRGADDAPGDDRGGHGNDDGPNHS
jgi:hypothetical protein